jgi:hypothetical protein
MGNINTDGFKQVWLGERYGAFRHNALNMSKRDTYFAPIGCHMTCDNMMHNEMVHKRLNELTAERREAIGRFLAEQGGAR